MERYNAFPVWCRKTFGRKLWRVALDAGMTCPNRDGTIDTRGCIFCDEGGSGDFAIRYHGQVMSREEFLYDHHEGKPGDFIAYFQAYTNTYAPVEKLRKLFTQALEDPMFAGISIATRPDCLGEDVLSLLEELKQTHPDRFIWCELGLQTAGENSARFIRRGYPLSVYDEAVQNLHGLKIPVITHVILGLPGEGKKEILETITHLDQVHTDGVKLQLLHYLKGTDLGRMYQAKPGSFHVLTEEEYVDLIAECIGHLDPDIVISRLTGDGNADLLLAPSWSLHKRRVLNEIGHALKERDITQGCLMEEKDEQ